MDRHIIHQQVLNSVTQMLGERQKDAERERERERDFRESFVEISERALELCRDFREREKERFWRERERECGERGVKEEVKIQFLEVSMSLGSSRSD